MKGAIVPNDSEKLMFSMMDAASAHYKAQGAIDEKGRAMVKPRQLLNAIASMGGAVVDDAPSGLREDIVRQFMEDFALHAGFKAEIKLKAVQ
jgi:hypothetical protein